MPRTRPPFRADMVGSLLRPQVVVEARARHAAGGIDAAALADIEDRAIAGLVARQEAIGLQAVTDGEIRRSWWHYDFLWNLVGVERVALAQGIQFAGVQTKAEDPRVTGRIGFPADHPFLAHFRHLAGVAKAVPKMTIPSPSMLHYRGGRTMIQMGVYPDTAEYFADLSEAYATAVRAFHDAGCRYLQLDDTSLAYLCDPDQRAMMAARGDDPDTLILRYRDMINAATKDRPSDMVITTHTCRGNFRSTFVARGGYAPLADLIFNEIDIDGYFMEWDDERSGGFEPLKYLPKGKHVVLGLVSTKRGALESRDDILRRIDQAARFTDIDQLCLSPQCGFASTEEGNALDEDAQWKKLDLVVSIARDVWG